MKFQVGDTVLVVHSKEEGEVVEIINNIMVMVDVRGVKFPAYIDQLDFPYFKRFTEKKLFTEQKQKKYIDQLPGEKKQRISKEANGVWLTFLPVFESDEFGEDYVESLKVHLVNNSQQAYHFDYHLNYFGKHEFELKNDIRVMEDFYLHDVPFEDLNDNPVFEFTFSLLMPDKKKENIYLTSLKLKPRQVFTRIEQTKEKGEATFSYKLFDIYPEKIVPDDIPVTRRSSAPVYEVSKAAGYLEPAKYEIDLHIEKLSPEANSLNNFEKLTLQLNTLEKYYELAVAHRLPSIIVIHGIGTGKLRDEVHEFLRLKKEVRSFVNQYDPRYGYGATEIFLQFL